MKPYKKLHKALIIAASIVTITFSAHATAATVSYSTDFDVNSTFRGDNPTSSFSAAIPFFNADLGTLRQVDIRYNLDLQLGIDISNRTLNPVPFSLGANSFLVEGPKFFDRFIFNNIIASSAIPETPLDVPAGTPLTLGSITVTLPGRSSYTSDIERIYFATSRPEQIIDIVIRPQGDVSPFIGTGNKLLEFLASTRNSLNLPTFGTVLSGVSSSSRIDVLGSVDVTYEYDAAVVPIPAAIPLFLSGLIGVGIFARKRKGQAC